MMSRRLNIKIAAALDRPLAYAYIVLILNGPFGDFLYTQFWVSLHTHGASDLYFQGFPYAPCIGPSQASALIYIHM
jgi:hypothetical protein